MQDDVVVFYNEHLRRFGAKSPKTLAWQNKNSQISRFKILSEIANLSGASILDEGCGLGDLYEYLIDRFRGIIYKGIDINEQLIRVAKEKYPATTFESCNFDDYIGEQVDYVLASGTLTFRVPDYKKYYFSQIAKMFSLARKGVGFNMLDHAFHEGIEQYLTYDMDEVKAFCLTLTDKVVGRRDYSQEDFTFYLYR